MFSIFKSPVLLACISLALVLVGCAHPYMDATHKFAESAKTGVIAIRPVFDSAAGLCRERANLDYLRTRLEQMPAPQTAGAAAPVKPAAWEPEWVKFFSEHQTPVAGKSMTWGDHCKQLARYDQLLTGALSALLEYAKALDQLTESADLDEKTVTSIGASLQSIAQGLVDGDGVDPKVAQIKNVVGPIRSLAQLIVAAKTEKELRRTVKAAGPHVNAVIASLKTYAEGMELERRDVESRRSSAINVIEATMGERAPSPADVLELYRFALEQQSRGREAKHTQDSYVALIEDLGAAHAELEGAADTPPTEKEKLLRVVTLSTEILEDVIAIRDTAKGD